MIRALRRDHFGELVQREEMHINAKFTVSEFAVYLYVSLYTTSTVFCQVINVKPIDEQTDPLQRERGKNEMRIQTELLLLWIDA